MACQGLVDWAQLSAQKLETPAKTNQNFALVGVATQSAKCA